MVSTVVHGYGRVNWVDAAKGIGILLVLLGHAPIPLEIRSFIYAFHMPLFFLLAGLFVKTNIPFGQFIKDKAVRLLMPYLFFSGVSYLIWLGIRKFSKMAMSIDPAQPLEGIFYGVGSGNWMPHNTPLWFLPCLFTTLLLLYFFSRVNAKVTALSLFVASLLGYAAALWVDMRLPWSLDVALVAVAFTGLGFMLRKWWLRPGDMSWPLTLSAAGLWLGASYLNSFWMPGTPVVDMNNEKFGHYFLFYLGGMGGVVFVCELARRLSGLQPLQYIGQRSQSIFCMHMLVYLFVTAFSKIVLHAPLAITYGRLSVENPSMPVIVAVLAYVIPGLIVPLVLVKLYEILNTGRVGFRKQEDKLADLVPAPAR